MNLRKINPKELFIEDIRLEIALVWEILFTEKAFKLCRYLRFVGCEVFENGVASLLAKIIKFRISNIRIHFGNCLDLIHNFNCLTLNKIYILFLIPGQKINTKKEDFLMKIIQRIYVHY